MLDTIPVPAQSKFGAAVARRLNSLRPIAPAGSLAMSGPTGTGFSPIPKNLRERRGVSATQPRQFDLRARVESRGEDDSKEYRLVVEFYHSTYDAVSLSGKSVSYTGGQQTISAGWNNLYTSSWSSDLDESKQYYLNVWIGAELDEDGKWTGFSTNDTRWWISDTQTSHVHSTSGNMALFRHGYLLGSVSAENSSASISQKFDGPLMFLDFVELGRTGGGGGSEGDIDGTNYPMPFQYKRTDTKDPETGEIVSSWSIIHNTFYWDGELQELEDYSPSGTCTVYLVCTQDAPSSSGEQEWEFEIAEEEGEAPEGGRVANYKLYDIEGYKVTMDYRTTFLELNSPHKVARFTVEKPEADEADPQVELDSVSQARATVKKAAKVAELTADDTTAKLTLTDGVKNVVIDPTGLSAEAPEAKFHTITVNNADGTSTTYYVLADKDITINEGGGLPDINVLYDIALNYDTSTHQLTATKTTINLKTQQQAVGQPQPVFTATPHRTAVT